LGFLGISQDSSGNFSASAAPSEEMNNGDVQVVAINGHAENAKQPQQVAEPTPVHHKNQVATFSPFYSSLSASLPHG